MSKQEEWWSGEDGVAYHQRNFVDWQKRIPFWDHVLTLTGARSVLEFGSGPGWNLSACKEVYPSRKYRGLEINVAAIAQAYSAGIRTEENLYDIYQSELVFTAGCLIHIPPDDINNVMKSLIDHSYRYVLSIEYEADEETEIEYRGQIGLLWKRPYTEMYRSLGLTLVDKGKLQEDAGFDNCTYALFTK